MQQSRDEITRGLIEDEEARRREEQEKQPPYPPLSGALAGATSNNYVLRSNLVVVGYQTVDICVQEMD